MSLKMKVWTLVDIALRVPPIFFMDLALKYGLGPRNQDRLGRPRAKVPEFKNESDFSETQNWFPSYTFEDIILPIFALALYIQVFIIALFVFFFTTKQLVLIYIRIASVIIILIAYELNSNYVNLYICRPKQHGLIQLLTDEISDHITLLILAFLFSITNTVNVILHIVIWILFFTPLLACTMSIPLSIIKITPIISAIGCAILLAYSMWLHGLQVCETVYRGITWCHTVVENYGLYTMIETHWVNLHIPQVFRAYWIIRLSEYILESVQEKGFHSLIISEMFKEVVTDGSENLIALLGMTSIVSFFCQLIGYYVQAFLQVNDPRERNIGNISAVLFLILSLQSGITRLDPETRYYRISRNLCLILTALLHFVYNIINPTLLSLSASKNPSTRKHVRSLITAVLLIIIPTIILIYQWRTQHPNTWLLAITSFMTELIIKTLVSISIYILFTVDAYKNGLWENLDDYVHYLKAIAGFTEFIIGIYLFINGLWIFTFESMGIIRACMMCLHAYFNIWIQGRRGWEYYQLRNTAMKKINFLQVATQEQLKSKKDVCAICFQELNTARITNCNHFFHGICLRKWLNVQDRCPLCHTSLYGHKT